MSRHRLRPDRGLPWILAALLWFAATGAAGALDHVVLKRDGRRLYASGKLLVEAQDGGLLILAADGTLWAVQPEELVEHTKDDLPFRHLEKNELAKKLLEKMPPGFKVYQTRHYLIGYNTSPAYARWCAGLYEQLYFGFSNYWKNRGIELHDPDMPLVALIFESQQTYARYGRAELGDATGSIVGYYSLRTNRVAMYDLTRHEALRGAVSRVGPSAMMRTILSRPEATPLVATIIHEATHQLAFNSGLMTRYADIPLWLSEGVAIFFETPDLQRGKGWRAIGAVNRPRLVRFRQYLHTRPADSLASLVTGDRRFLDMKTALDAYAEAWALTYFLVRNHPQEYVRYLKQMSKKGPLLEDTPEERLDEFKAAFGDDLEKLDAEMVRFTMRL